MKYFIRFFLLTLTVLSALFVGACGEKTNNDNNNEGISVVRELEEEYKSYLASFVESENIGDLSFDDATVLSEEYTVGEKVFLPNVVFPSGNEKIFIQKIDTDNVTFYKSFDPLKKGDSVIFEEDGRFVICFVQDNKEGTVYNKNFYVNVVKKTSFDFSSLPHTIGIGEKVAFDKILFYHENETVIADVYCINPRGEGIDVSDGIFKPDIIGEYEFIAVANGGAFKDSYTINVVADTSDLFVSDLMTIVPDYDLPSWSVKGSGILLCSDVIDVTARYQNVVDLASLSSDTPLIEFQVMYGEDGDYNFVDMGTTYYPPQFLRVRLIDVNDPTRKVEVAWRSDEWYYNSGSKAYSFITTAAKDADMDKWFRHNDPYGEKGRFTFEGSDGISANAPLFNFSYDYKENSAYYFSDGVKKFLSDYSSTDEWGRNAFDKFTTGEVYVEVFFGCIFGGTGGIVVTSIAGNSLAGSRVSSLDELDETSLSDNVKPIFKFEFDDEFLADMPTGYVGVKYPVPKCYSLDALSGECKLNVLVKNDENGKTYSADKGYFVPTEKGDYSIVYSSTDGFGNVANKVLKVNVFDTDVPLIEFSFIDELPAFMGMNYQIPTIAVSGGSGEVDYSYKIFYNDKEVFTDGFNRIFLNESGELKFVFDAEDYLGTDVASEELTIEVGISKETFININGVVPKYVRYGEVLVLPDFEAICYGDTVKSFYVEINGNRLASDRKYNVYDSVGSVLNVKYVAESDKEYCKSFEMSVINPYQNVETAFVTENVVDSTLKENELEFTVDGNAKIKTPNPLLSTEFSLNFGFDTDKLFSVKISLIDCYNGDNIVYLNFEKSEKNKKIAMDINGKHLYDISPYIYDGTFANVYLKFNSSSGRLSDYRDVLYAYVTDGALSESFNGFENNIFYVEIEIATDVEAVFDLYAIGNQVFGKYANDIAYGPQILVESSISSKEVITGDNVAIPMAKGYDLFDGNCEVIVSVSAPSGEMIIKRKICDKEYNFTITEIGVYTVKFESSDKSGGNSSILFLFNNLDLESPIIEVDMKDGNYKVNSSLTIKPAIVSDNVSENVNYYVYLIGADNVYNEVEVGRTYVFEKAGVYRLVYLAKDSAYNIGRKVILINVW